MVDYKYKDLYDEDSVKKEIKIAWDTGEIGNTDLHSEKITLTESLCSDDELRFGACEASELKFRISNVFEPLKGKKLSFSSFFTGHADVPFQFGEFTVDSDTKSADRKYRDITAYDKMYDIINAEVSAWYNSLTFPLTLKAFRDSFCAYVGVEQEDVALVNDSMVVEETIKPSELSGQTVIEAICEINGRFGHIGRNGKLQYVKLEPFQKGLYPSTTLFPAKDLFPQKASVMERLSKSKYISCQYEDFICKTINKLQIRQSENDIGAISGTGNNCYVVEDNFLVYGKSAEDLQIIANNLYSVIRGVWYRPTQIEAKGNPCYEVGDGIIVNTSQDVIYTYILVRTLSGIQALRDSYLSEGEEYRSKQVNGVAKSIVQLRGKVNELTRNVEETKSEIKDVESGLDTKITQTAEKIESEATRATSAEGTLNSRITQTAESITSEVERATSKEDELSSKITQTAEKIESEATRATSAEGTLNSRITQTAGQISSEVTRAQGVENNLSSQISQAAEQILLKVSKGDVSAQLSVESGQISISGNRFVLDSTNFSITADGKVTAKSIDIQGGTINLQSASQNYSTIVLNYSNYTLGMDGAGIRASRGSDSTILTASGITATGSLKAKNLYVDNINTQSATSGTINMGNNVKISGDTELAIGHTHKIYGTLNIDVSGLSINAPALSITSTGGISVGKSLGYLGFFGIQGSTKKTVSKISSTSTTATSTVANKVNDLITALQAYGLIG